MKSNLTMINMIFFLFLLFSFIDFSNLSLILDKSKSLENINNVENLRSKLNRVRNQFLSINRDCLIEKAKNLATINSLKDHSKRIDKVYLSYNDVKPNIGFTELSSRVSGVKGNNQKHYFMLVDLNNSNSRVLKLLCVILMVATSSVLCFLLVKASVDWAGISKLELNKMRDEELSKTTEEINLTYNINRNYID